MTQVVTAAAKVPKDAAEREAQKNALAEKMKESLKAQGGFGIMQTKKWLKVYKRAVKVCKRDYPTVSTCKKVMAALEDACMPFEGGAACP